MKKNIEAGSLHEDSEKKIDETESTEKRFTSATERAALLRQHEAEAATMAMKAETEKLQQATELAKAREELNEILRRSDK